MPIHLLPEHVINKIAAGEVIERPASIVKELIENAIDARATIIEVDLTGGGAEQITIRDNGLGMSRADASLAFRRHATSKLASEDDLWHIQTLGFRGEALASIAAVAEVELITKEQGETQGHKVMVGPSQAQRIEPAGAPGGTTIIVRKLFAALPVRRKYLKSFATEHMHCVEVVTDYALAYPDVAFQLRAQGKTILRADATNDWFTRIQAVLGDKDAASLIAIEDKLNQYTLRAYIGKPASARRSRKHQYSYVNRRRIDDYLIGYRVREGFHTLLPRELHPIFVINLEIPPELVDVNIHPRKAQVRFQEPQLVYQLVEQATIKALRRHDIIPRALSPSVQSQTTSDGQLPTQSHEPSPPTITTDQADFGQLSHGETTAPSQPSTWHNTPAPLTQLYQTYILGRDAQGIFIIDQHAAQERIAYEALLANLHANAKQSQPLLLPMTIELSAREADLLAHNLELFAKLDLEPFGPQSFTIRAVPALLSHADPVRLVKDLLDELAAQQKNKSSQQAVEEKLIMRACRSSIKAHDKLSSEQMQNIVEQLFTCEQPLTCPHGRPTVIRLEERELEKWFKRSGF
jgi:DNA mismatch repair protein MutL